jgi:molybdopterin-binding protein
MPTLLKPRDAALRLGISYPTIKQWIYQKKVKTIITSGGHHRIPESELDQFLGTTKNQPLAEKRRSYRDISGRNQLVGRVTEIKVSGLMAQVKLSIGGQMITSIITAEAVREMGLKIGETAAALVKSTEVMIVRL